MNFLEKLFNTGIDGHIPEWKAEKIVQANQTPIFGFISSLIFSYIIWLNYPALTFAPIIVLITCLFHYFIAWKRWHNLSRILASNLSGLALFIIHLGLIKPGEPLLLPLFVFQVVICLMPWLAFDQREEKLLLGTNLFNLLLLILTITIDGQNTWGYDAELLKGGTVYYTTLILATIFFFGALIGMHLSNKKVAQKQDGIIGEMHEKQQELEVNSQQLNQYIEEVDKARQEDERRQWIAKGTGEIDKILRSNLDMTSLQDELIKSIVNYSKSNQGGLFILQDEHAEDLHLNLSACYAFNRKKFINKRIEIGQGLVGQCYLEAEMTLLTEIPENYVTITSGLGDANPQCLILLPLIHNEKVQGVLELASFHNYDPHEIQYLKKVANSLASYIITLKTNERTEKLLEEFKEQAETMRAQEEEMRQNFEELMATQEQMNRLKQEEESKYQELLKDYQKLKEEI